MMDHLRAVIYPEIEPGVICKEMIVKAYFENGYKGEALRLHQLEPVKYENIKVLRLEGLNILRIDHLWMMPNLTKLYLNCNNLEVIENIGMLTALKELNLSFNYIEKIENLDTLVNLEILNLFNNMITKLENLDALENLIILSVGNNEIYSTEGIERLRFLKKLRVLNMEGNPFQVLYDCPISTYAIAVLPQIQYYEYVYIEDEVRNAAKEKFYRELRDIEANEEDEIEMRNRRAKELAAESRLSSSFVEKLNEHQLFDSLWEGDDDGHALIQIGGEALEELLAEYRSDFFNITQEIFKLGLEKYEDRKSEIELYMNSVEVGQLAIQRSGHKTIEKFLIAKDKIFKDATHVLKQLEVMYIQGEDEELPECEYLLEQFEGISVGFQERTTELWHTLMGDELYLYESCMEVTAFFERCIGEMMSKFVEQTQTYFAQLRDVAIHFSENLQDLVQQYIGMKLATRHFDDVPEELKICLEDKDAVMNFIAGMKDHQTQKIDEREDRLVMRSKQFIAELIEGLQKDNLERNRSKILEVNSFIDQMMSHLNSLQSEIREQMLNENI